MISLLFLVFLGGCSPVGPAEIPMQNDTRETIVGGESPDTADNTGGGNLEANTTPELVENDTPSPVIEVGPQSVYVSLIGVGFSVPEVTIKVGETVAWKNEREGRQQRAMVLGTQWCAFVKSGFFNPGEVYRATFNKIGTCTVVDGMYTTETMKVIVTS